MPVQFKGQSLPHTIKLDHTASSPAGVDCCYGQVAQAELHGGSATHKQPGRFLRLRLRGTVALAALSCGVPMAPVMAQSLDTPYTVSQTVGSAADISGTPNTGIAGKNGRSGYYTCDSTWTWGEACVNFGYSGGFGRYKTEGATKGRDAPESGTYTEFETSDPNVAGIVDYDPTMAADDFTITVEQLVEQVEAKVIDSTQAPSQPALINGGYAFDLVITDQNGTPTTLEFRDTTDPSLSGGVTLAALQAAINAADLGLTASIVPDENNKPGLTIVGAAGNTTDFTLALTNQSLGGGAIGDPLTDLTFGTIADSWFSTQVEAKVINSTLAPTALINGGHAFDLVITNQDGTSTTLKFDGVERPEAATLADLQAVINNAGLGLTADLVVETIDGKPTEPIVITGLSVVGAAGNTTNFTLALTNQSLGGGTIGDPLADLTFGPIADGLFASEVEAKVISSAQVPADTALINGGHAFDLVITDQSGTSTTLKFDDVERPEAATLADLQAAINAAGLGLTASIVVGEDGNPGLSIAGAADNTANFTLALTNQSENGGTIGDPLTDLTFGEIAMRETVIDAKYTVTANGISTSYTWPSNMITVEGVNIRLVGTSPDPVEFKTTTQTAGVDPAANGNAGQVGTAISDSKTYTAINVAGTAVTLSTSGGAAGQAQQGGTGGAGGKGGDAMTDTVPRIHFIPFPPITIPDTDAITLPGAVGGKGAQGGTGGKGDTGGTGGAIDFTLNAATATASTLSSATSTGGQGGQGGQGGTGGKGGAGGDAKAAIEANDILPVLRSAAGNNGGKGGTGGTGGDGGTGGTGGAVTLTTALGDAQATDGHQALSIGGKGGVGGKGGQGGQGGTGGQGAAFTDYVIGAVSEHGETGGNGGTGFTGGKGGTGGNGGTVTLTNGAGALVVINIGLLALSQGGEGGTGGMGGQGGQGGTGGDGKAITNYAPGGLRKEAASNGGSAGNADAGGLGGAAGMGGNGGIVTVSNAGVIEAGKHAIHAASLGGIGGTGGAGGKGGTGGTGGEAGAVGPKVDGFYDGINGTSGAGGNGGTGAAGGNGAAGGHGGIVTVTNTASLTTTGSSFSSAILAESLGAIGGLGGAAGAAGDAGVGGAAGSLFNSAETLVGCLFSVGLQYSYNNNICSVTRTWAAGASGTAGTASTEAGVASYVGGNGGAVSVTNGGTVLTQGLNSDAILAISMGGVHGLAEYNPNKVFRDGLVRNSGGIVLSQTGGADNVDITNTGNVKTQGDQSSALIGLSVGAGYGAGTVSVTNSGQLETEGDDAPALVAASRVYALGDLGPAHADDVTANNSGGIVLTSGEDSTGIHAESWSEIGAAGDVSVNNTQGLIGLLGSGDTSAILALSHALGTGAASGSVTILNVGGEIDSDIEGSAYAVDARSISASGNAGGISFDNTDGKVYADGDAILLANTATTGNTGDISVNNTDGRVYADGDAVTLTSTTTTGNAGGISFNNTDGKVYADGDAVTLTSTTATGNAGGISFNNTDGRVYADGDAVTLTSTTATGNAGGISFDNTDGKVYANGDAISLTNTTTTGNAGNITVNNTRGAVSADGDAVTLTSTAENGDAGSIEFNNTGGEVKANGDAITLTSTAGDGDAGDIAFDNSNGGVVHAAGNAVTIASTAETGDAGAISFDNTDGEVMATGDAITLTNSAITGNAGNIEFDNADGVVGANGDAVTITSTVETGNAGGITFNNTGGEVNAAGNAITLTSMAGEGDAGNIALDNSGGEVNAAGDAIILTSMATDGDAGDITFDNTGGAVNSAGNAVTIASTATGGDAGTIDVTNASSIQCGNAACTAVTLNSTGTTGGNITLTNGGLIQGGAGGTAIALIGGNTNLIKNDGTIDPDDDALIKTAKGVDDTVITGTTGHDRIENHAGGWIIGSVDLGAGTNAFHNYFGSYFLPGTMIDLGAGNFLTNDGYLSLGDLGRVMETTLTGNFAQSGTGYMLTDLSFAAGSATEDEVDLVTVTGTAALAGFVQLNLLTKGASAPGNHRHALLTAGGGILGWDDLHLHEQLVDGTPTTTVTFKPSLDVEGDTLYLVYDVNYAPDWLTVNQTSYANMVTAIQAQGVPAYQPITDALMAITDPTEYRKALDSLTGEGTTVAQHLALEARGSFMDEALGQSSLLSACASNPDLPLLDCERGIRPWASVRRLTGNRDLDRTYGPYENNEAAFSQNFSSISFGAEKMFDGDVSLGWAVNVSQGSYSVPERWTHGDMTQVNMALTFAKTFQNNAYLRGTISAGHGRHEQERLTFLNQALSEAPISGNFTSQSIGGKLEAGWRSDLGITPFAAFAVDHQRRSAFTENDAPLLGNHYPAQTTRSREITAGLEVKQSTLSDAGTLLSAAARLSGSRELTPERNMTVSSQAAPGFSAEIIGMPKPRNYVSLDLELNARFQNNIGVMAGFSTTSRSGSDNQSARLSFEYRF